MLTNKRGLSLIGLLLVLIIILILTHITLKQMTKKGPNNKPQISQTVQNVRNAVKDMEKAAAYRANTERYK